MREGQKVRRNKNLASGALEALGVLMLSRAILALFLSILIQLGGGKTIITY